MYCERQSCAVGRDYVLWNAVMCRWRSVYLVKGIYVP